jgi:[ribosomal protein S5]-alanine N-acetyltransferase
VRPPAGDPVEIRPLGAEDAEAVAALLRRNRAYLEPWEPRRPESWFTLEGQREALAAAAALRAEDRAYRFGILAAGELVGQVALSNVLRGPLDGANLGYWVDASSTGRGYATSAVVLAVRFGFEEIRLHGVEAAVMPRNIASIRVLQKAGFRREGLAPRYLRIAGEWEDHELFAITREEWSGREPTVVGRGAPRG